MINDFRDIQQFKIHTELGKILSSFNLLLNPSFKILIDQHPVFVCCGWMGVKSSFRDCLVQQCTEAYFCCGRWLDGCKTYSMRLLGEIQKHKKIINLKRLVFIKMKVIGIAV
jgi:hypothetical protein